MSNCSNDLPLQGDTFPYKVSPSSSKVSPPFTRCHLPLRGVTFFYEYLRSVVILYNFFLFLYRLAIDVTSLWNSKARAWQEGRRRQWEVLERKIPPVVNGQRRFWMHCASLGEFEQGRPILEALRSQYPDCKIILSFFSPSGYEVRKDYPGADVICYLPMDGPVAAKRFLDLVQPTQALFVKYEFWHYYLKELSARQIPAMLVSGAFRSEQPFFKWWGGFFRKILSRFTILTVQDEQSLILLESIGLAAQLSGDTRYDRVVQIAAEAKPLPLIEIFKGQNKLIIAGSTWPEDERMLKECLKCFPDGWKLVLAPHEIDEAHLKTIQSLFGEDCIFYSQFKPGASAKVLVIDNIGMLSSLYGYGEIACIGGGYNKGGIHNVLEPAVFGLPVIMGPVYGKFTEAVEMAQKGFAFPAPDAGRYSEILQHLMEDDAGRNPLQHFIKAWVRENTGATSKILKLLSGVD